ncbi:HAD family hydrolase [bacterium]|nr:HAD family hydrolase [bacterium]
MIKVITFDLWDTVFIDDSDEPKRKKMGLDPKPVERRNIVQNILEKSTSISREHINVAYNVTDTAFRHVWYQQNTTWTVAERLDVLLKGLGQKIPEEDFKEMVRLHEEMELDIMPDLAPNITEAIQELSKKYKLAVISDAIFSPGRVLRGILENYGLLQYFESFVFSDEVGCAKPNPEVFNIIAKHFKVKPSEIAHIGDREEKDIDGPHAVNAKAILTTVVLDRGSKSSKADVICNNYNNLLDCVSTL